MNLGRDLRWVAKRTRKFPRKRTQVAKKIRFKADYPIFHWHANLISIKVSTSHRKSTQVLAKRSRKQFAENLTKATEIVKAESTFF